MLHKKLLEVLNHLTPAEHKRLRLFLNSPYFNNTLNSGEILRLYDYILQHDAKEESPALSKEVVFHTFFPEQPFQEKVKSQLDERTSELFRLVRRFLAQIETERESREVSEHLALARFYRKFSFEERFWQTMRAMRKMQQDSPRRDAQYYFQQFQLEEEEQLFRGLHNSYEDDTNLNAVHKNLDLYYSILKLEYTCLLIYQKRIAQIEWLPTDLLIKSVVELSNDGSSLDVPINRIYRLIVNLLQKPYTQEDLDYLDTLLHNNQEQISIEKFKDLKTHLRFLWLQHYYKSGDSFLLRHIFKIYREHLSQGYFYFDGLIPFTTFRNLVVSGLILGEFDWVKIFLDTHSPKRIGGTRYPAEAHSLNMAEYFFHLKKYEKAQETLVYRHFENPAFSIAADLLLLRIYYETDNELLESRIRALDQKIRRSKLSREVKNRYYNFLKKLDKIIKYGGQTQNPKRARLIEEIKASSEIVAREWLLKKLSEG